MHDERFSVDHIVARKHGGSDDAENLALCCLRCNLHKGPNLSGIDPISREVVTLFNPRRQQWPDHFRWNGPLLVAITNVARTTIHVLAINAPERVQLRQSLIDEWNRPLD